MKELLEAMELLDARIVRLAEQADADTHRRLNELGNILRDVSSRASKAEELARRALELAERLDKELSSR